MPKSLTPEAAARKEKREARREKQRAANVTRAGKMHDARLADPGKRPAPPPPDGIYIGCSGWFYWHWRGLFYPDAMPTKDWLPHYMAKFRTVELNAPFYSWPTLATVNAWLKQAGRKRFLYTVKVNELITHTRRFENTQTLVEDFGYIADLLGRHMGCFLFQLPPSYDYTPARLAAITAQLDPARRNVVEFRHKTWWNDTVYAAFRKHNIAFCSVSAPRLPEELVTTAEDAYIRFHGKKAWYRHDYTPEELTRWAAAIKQSPARRIWVYFNNDREAFAVKNARQLKKLLAESAM